MQGRWQYHQQPQQHRRGYCQSTVRQSLHWGLIWYTPAVTGRKRCSDGPTAHSIGRSPRQNAGDPSTVPFAGAKRSTAAAADAFQWAGTVSRNRISLRTSSPGSVALVMPSMPRAYVTGRQTDKKRDGFNVNTAHWRRKYRHLATELVSLL